VYVLKEGRVVEQGYRSDLEDVVVSAGRDRGKFRKMMLSQSETGGFVPREDVPRALSARSSYAQLREKFAAAADMDEGDDATTLATSSSIYQKHHSLGLRPLTFGTWMFEAVGDLTGSVRNLPTIMESSKHQSFSATLLFYDYRYTYIPDRQRRPSTIYELPSKHEHLRIQIPTSPTAAHTLPARRYSLPPPTPTSATFTNSWMMTGFDHEEYHISMDCERKNSMEMSADTARQARVVKEGTVRTRWDGSRDAMPSFIKVEKLGTEEHDVSFEGERVEVNIIDSQPSATPGLFKLFPSIFSSISRAQTFLLFFGIFICLLNGAMTPIFSFLLSRLLFEVSSGAQDLSVIDRFGVLVLGITALDDMFLGLKYFSMEISAMHP
jgi:ATP-binding cassette, subfamily B (MDR/TAP), member 1